MDYNITDKPQEGKIAFSKFFNSYIKCTRYISDTCWLFKLCNEYGGPTTHHKSRPAHTFHSDFEWMYPKIKTKEI